MVKASNLVFWLCYAVVMGGVSTAIIMHPAYESVFIVYFWFFLIFFSLFFVIPQIANTKIKREGVIGVLLFVFLFIPYLFSALFDGYAHVSLKRFLLIACSTLAIALLMATAGGYRMIKLANVVVFSIVLMVCVLVICSVALVLFGDFVYIQQIGQVNELSFGVVKFGQLYIGESSPRLSSLTGNPNSFGAMLLLSLIGCLYLRRIRFYWFKSFPLMVAVLCLLILGFSFSLSRGSIGSALIGCGVFAFLSQKNKYNKFFFLCSVTAILFFGFLVFNSLDYLEGNRASLDLSGRDKIWNLVLTRMSENPFLGIGMGASAEYLNDAGISLISVHNSYLSIILESGVIGFFVFVIIIVFVFYVAFKNIWHARTKEFFYFYVFAASTLFSMLLNQVVESLIFQMTFFHVVFVFFVFLILLNDPVCQEK